MAKKSKPKRKSRSLCLFCVQEKCSDDLCAAKREIFRAYCKRLKPHEVLGAIHQGLIKLDVEAKALLYDRHVAKPARSK